MNKKNWIIGIAAIVIAIIFPFVAPKFQLRMFTEIIILTLFAMTWKMMLNEGGMFSFGHAVYFGLGHTLRFLGGCIFPACLSSAEFFWELCFGPGGVSSSGPFWCG